MKIAQRATLTLLTLILFILAFVTIQGSRNLTCESPHILGAGLSPAQLVNETVLALGGLPQTNVDLGLILHNWGGNLAREDEAVQPIPPIYPVKEWFVEPASLTTTQFNFQGLLNDSSKYSYQFDVHTTYENGKMATIHWSSWGYGTAACPLLISTGQGEPGKLTFTP
ncbi:MAG: hypothetical protein H6662_12635 [Ardenticatenaceae bacterium]|nr:hypothetical protein [Anaerolineales bacterium]MCB8922424.1 hypothetical protein [Ardenticatenaceae bacterium]MCB8991356.1 hypothetical protein [Ardenticatenaceae bacterium]MCB9005578.1 hypothetical protein [Ardenticatenaceae bacterium]